MAHRVLLVDDVADLRFLLRVVLEQAGGFEVVGEAGDGARALALAERARPDMIVLDLSMPTMDGLEALPALRALVPDAIIVVLSAFEGTRIAPSTTRLGADAYFEKGTPPSLIVAKLRELAGLTDAPVREEVSPSPALDDGQLLQVAAHDMKSLVGSIVSLGATIEERWGQLDDEMRRTMVRRMTSQARDLHAIADNLAADPRVSLEPVAPAALLTDIASAVTPLCGEHPLKVTVQPELPVVLVDRLALLRIIVNLVTNARAHAPAHTPIGLSARADGPYVVVEVTDRGPGIPVAERARVLKKHMRLDGSDRGLGLGLHIATTLAEAMGGSIEITDRDGGGASVVCRLRCADPSG